MLARLAHVRGAPHRAAGEPPPRPAAPGVVAARARRLARGAPVVQSPLEHARTRARRLAFMLFEQGDDLSSVEHALLGIGFHPTICRESAEWAHERHRAAFEAAATAARFDRTPRRSRVRAADPAPPPGSPPHPPAPPVSRAG